MKPCVPFLPLVPFGPRLPRGPWTPLGPGGPGRQTLPGAMQNDFLIIEFMYFLIPSRTSCKPSKSLLFASKLRRTISFLSTRPVRGKFSNNLRKKKSRKQQQRNLNATTHVILMTLIPRFFFYHTVKYKEQVKKVKHSHQTRARPVIFFITDRKLIILRALR